MRKVFVPVTRSDEWSAVLEAIRADHYHLLTGRQDLSVGEFLTLLLKSPGGSLLTFDARVVRVTPGKGAALEVYAQDERKPRAWKAALARSEPRPEEAGPVLEAPTGELTVREFESPGGEFDTGVAEILGEDTRDQTIPEGPAPLFRDTAPAPEAEADAKTPEEPADEGARQTAFGRVASLSVTEKQRLAIQATRAERAVLVRDTMKQVHLFGFKNPRIQPEEVQEYAKYGGLSPQAIQYIAEHVRWMQSPQLRLTLVRNPQVPRDVAIRLIEGLQPNDVRALAKSDGVRPDVRGAARKWLEKRGLL